MQVIILSLAIIQAFAKMEPMFAPKNWKEFDFSINKYPGTFSFEHYHEFVTESLTREDNELQKFSEIHGYSLTWESNIFWVSSLYYESEMHINTLEGMSKFFQLPNSHDIFPNFGKWFQRQFAHRELFTDHNICLNEEQELVSYRDMKIRIKDQWNVGLSLIKLYVDVQLSIKKSYDAEQYYNDLCHYFENDVPIRQYEPIFRQPVFHNWWEKYPKIFRDLDKIERDNFRSARITLYRANVNLEIELPDPERQSLSFSDGIFDGFFHDPWASVPGYMGLYPEHNFIIVSIPSDFVQDFFYLPSGRGLVGILRVGELTHARFVSSKGDEVKTGRSYIVKDPHNQINSKGDVETIQKSYFHMMSHWTTIYSIDKSNGTLHVVNLEKFKKRGTKDFQQHREMNNSGIQRLL